MNRIEKHAKNTFIILMLIMLFWIFMSFIFQKLLFPPSKNNLTTYEALKYYTHLRNSIHCLCVNSIQFLF